MIINCRNNPRGYPIIFRHFIRQEQGELQITRQIFYVLRQFLDLGMFLSIEINKGLTINLIMARKSHSRIKKERIAAGWVTLIVLVLLLPFTLIKTIKYEYHWNVLAVLWIVISGIRICPKV